MLLLNCLAAKLHLELMKGALVNTAEPGSLSEATERIPKKAVRNGVRIHRFAVRICRGRVSA